MEDILYNNIDNGSYYIITSKGSEWNVCIDIFTLKYKFLDNNILNTFNKIYLSKNAISDIFNILDINDNINLDDFDEYKNIYYKLTIIKINTWIDLLNFIITLY